MLQSEGLFQYELLQGFVYAPLLYLHVSLWGMYIKISVEVENYVRGFRSVLQIL